MTSDATFNTVHLHAYLERMRGGDRAAADCLIQNVCGRLERLARKMLHGFPNVKRHADTEDVLQSALVRLLRSLQTIRPESTRDFVNLAAVHIRRELLDLARHFRARLDVAPGDAEADVAEAPDQHTLTGDLDLWSTFHTLVDQLPVEEREVVALTFYHGWTQAEIGTLLDVDERTIRRRWRSACLKLSAGLGGRLPEV